MHESCLVWYSVLDYFWILLYFQVNTAHLMLSSKSRLNFSFTLFQKYSKDLHFILECIYEKVALGM